MSERRVNGLTQILAASIFAVGLVVAPAHAGFVVYDVDLDGPSEAPPNASPGTGSAEIILDTDLLTMRIIASFQGLIGNTTNAHIHCCTAVPEAGTAGVATQTPSFIGFPLGVTSGTYDHTFDMTLAGSYNPAFIGAHGGTPALAYTDLIAGFDADKAYLNIHTTVVPGGEIRGFLQQVPEPTTLSLLGIAAAGLAWRRRKT